MEKQLNNELITRVHTANAEAHDYHAKSHDRNVPYIHRKTTRKYYWQLLKNACNSHGTYFKNSHVLEIGCGTGTFTDLVLSHNALDFHGIDLSPKMIEVARAKTKDKRAFYSVSSLESFADNHENEFDIIFSASFLHHLVDIENGVRLIKSMLRPGGVYVGLHEPTTSRKLTLIERIDKDLQYLFGYAGAIYTPFYLRAKNLFKGLIISLSLRSKIIKLLVGIYIKIKRYFKSKNDITTHATEIQSKINYVDYQLNEEFSLIKKIGSFGEVIPYCYLGFIELMKISKPLNHEMFIMVKEKNN